MENKSRQFVTYPLIFLRNFPAHLNVTTLLGFNIIESPVAGLTFRLNPHWEALGVTILKVNESHALQRAQCAYFIPGRPKEQLELMSF